ncbi:secreted protein [Dothidotthia symphoricarpi CBS 119687]|uniref:Secreted protein n=1 Tax=Dothidotthia symphoricarpi CBS 119687 TaxID=1392245 RepID=A0A6A6A8I8_9PLEO|nr:uncharacterized protein P153DRAFT_387685 [Dothidotthia symphoricarpi CBS 119687]KAF2127137.1 secreted protein [Dothidotthia symphoricarpi CBS 119687]
MSSLLFFIAAAQLTNAYTQVNVASPFMTKNIDPIVVPGAYKSHLHSFFGSDAVTLNTNTSAELQAGCTNAENPNDLSVYWVPTPLYTTDGGATYSPIPVMRFSAYYNLGEAEAQVPIPQNLKMVAGKSAATTAADMVADAKATWSCEGGGSAALDANGFPSSTCSTHLQQLLYFPSCVNTDTLETAYKSGKSCPSGMSSMPQLRFSIRYDLRSVLPDGWSGTAPIKLACGNAYCSHGDFINGWTVEAAQNMLATTKEKMHFSSVDGALGTYNSGPTCKATDADPENGTSDFAKSVEMMQKRSLAGWARSRIARGL